MEECAQGLYLDPSTVGHVLQKAHWLSLTASPRPERKRRPHHCVRDFAPLGQLFGLISKSKSYSGRCLYTIGQASEFNHSYISKQNVLEPRKSTLSIPQTRWAVQYPEEQHVCETLTSFHKTSLVFQTACLLSCQQLGIQKHPECDAEASGDRKVILQPVQDSSCFMYRQVLGRRMCLLGRWRGGGGAGGRSCSFY